jgi:hypothetical protein
VVSHSCDYEEYWDIIYNMVKVNRRFVGTLSASCFLALLFDPEDGGYILPETLVDLHRTARRNIEDKTL